MADDVPESDPGSCLKELSGTTLGRYTLLTRLGSGGMGDVYRARSPDRDFDVAIKVMAKSGLPDREAEVRFQREFSIQLSLDHPNLVRLFEKGEDGDLQFLVMELVSGRDLASVFQSGERMPLDRVVSMARKLVAGISYLHENGIVHRDLKPANVLISEAREIKITDFGLARTADSTILTRANTVMGTVQYLSPEQVIGQPASPASDLYAFGLILYEMLTDDFPYHAEDFRGWLTRIAVGAPAPIDPDGTGIPVPLADLAMSLLAKKPGERPGILQILRVLDGVKPTAAPSRQSGRIAGPTPGPETPVLPGLTRPWLRPVLLLACAATLTVLTWTVLSGGSSRQPEPQRKQVVSPVTGEPDLPRRPPPPSSSPAGPEARPGSGFGRGSLSQGGEDSSAPSEALEPGPESPSPSASPATPETRAARRKKSRDALQSRLKELETLGGKSP